MVHVHVCNTIKTKKKVNDFFQQPLNCLYILKFME